MLFEVGLTKRELTKCKIELKPKVLFYKDWIFVVNLLKHDPIKGKKNTLWAVYQKEIEALSKDIKGALMGDQGGIDGALVTVRKGNDKETVGKGLKLIKKKRKELKI